MLIRDLAVRGLLTEPVSTGPSAVDDGLDVSLEAFTSPHVTEQEDLLAAAALPANNWIRTKLGNVVVLSYGKSLPKKARNAYGKIPTYGSNGAVGFHDESLIHEPCLVIGRKGSSGAVNVTNGPSWPIDTAYFVVPPKGLTLQFLFILLRAIRLDRFDRSTAIPGLNRTDAYALTVLLPPLAEQKRIVAKVDQLMALCDELEARQTKKRETGSRLTKSALEALTTAETPEDFNRAWTRVSKNFDVLIDDIEKVSFLRRAILDTFTGGRTAAHDWETRPLRELLAVPLSNGRSVPDGGANGTPVLRLSALRGRYVDFSESKLGAWTATEAKPFAVTDGDLLIVRGNGAIRLVGRSCIAKDSPKLVAFPDTVIRARPDPGRVDTHWLWLWWESSLARSQIEQRARTTAGIFKVSQDDIYDLLVPVPPLEQQRKLVALIDKFMDQCDALESKLRTAGDLATKLAGALVSSATTSEAA